MTSQSAIDSWQSLQGLVAGRLRLSGEPGFDEASAPFNRRFAHVRPSAALSAATVDDVVATVRWARENGTALTVRGRGHSYAGTSVSPGLTLDLRALNSISFDPSTGLMTAGGATRMRELCAALEQHDVAIPFGNSDDVGIGGLALGGGVSFVSRAYGLTCDRLVSTDVVLADGSVVTADQDHEPDLFWASRGGGGHFGVHTSFTFETRPAAASSTCRLVWEWDDARDVLIAAQQIMHLAPNAFTGRVGIGRSQGEPGTVSVSGQYLGPAEELREFLAPLIAAVRPVSVSVADRTFWEAKDDMLYNSAADSYAARTRTARGPLSAAGIEAAVATVEKWPGCGNPDGAGVTLFTWGGAINDVPTEDTAFPHRDTQFLVYLRTSWSTEDSPATVRENLRWLGGFYDQMAEFATDGSYANFADPDLEDWETAYYGPNRARLTEVKRHYDPDLIFGSGLAP